MHKQYSCQSLSFISGVVPLRAGPNSTRVESHRNTSMALLPASLVITPVDLLASPPCTRTLYLLSSYSFFSLNFFTFHLFISNLLNCT